MDESKKYKVIKALADHPNGSKDRAALTLGCTKRHINRMLAGYRKEGKAFFLHGNRGRKPLPLSLKLSGAPLLTFTAQNTMKLIFSIIQNSWLNVRTYTSPFLLSPKYWKPNISFLRRLRRTKEKRMKKETSCKKKNSHLPKKTQTLSRPILWPSRMPFQTPKMYLFRRNAADGRCFLRMGAWTDLALTSRC